MPLKDYTRTTGLFYPEGVLSLDTVPGEEGPPAPNYVLVLDDDLTGRTNNTPLAGTFPDGVNTGGNPWQVDFNSSPFNVYTTAGGEAYGSSNTADIGLLTGSTELQKWIVNFTLASWTGTFRSDLFVALAFPVPNYPTPLLDWIKMRRGGGVDSFGFLLNGVEVLTFDFNLLQMGVEHELRVEQYLGVFSIYLDDVLLGTYSGAKGSAGTDLARFGGRSVSPGGTGRSRVRRVRAFVLGA